MNLNNSDQVISPNTIHCEKSGRTFFISFSRVIRNSTWANYWGVIQQELRSLSAEIQYVVINAQQIEWMDPFPLLSLLLGIAEIHDTGIKFFYVIADDSSLTVNQKRFLAFLETEGFLAEMQTFKVRLIDSSVSEEIYKDTDLSEYEKTLLDRIKGYNGYISSDDSTILKAKVVDLQSYPGESRIDSLIETELEHAKHRIRLHLTDSLMNEIIWKTGLYLKETINNVYEHAYEGDSHKYVGYYIRHRIGLMDYSLDSDTRQAYERKFKQEHYDVGCFDMDFPISTTSFIEAFVIDAGIGLTEHYSSRRKNKEKSLKEVWRETIGDGIRNQSKKKNTRFGGLYTLSRLLKDEFLIARDYDCWTGSVLPVQKVNTFYQSTEVTSDGIDVKGLAIMCRIAFKKAMDNSLWVLTEDTGKLFQEAMKEERGVYEKYFNSSFRSLEHPLSYIKDDRVDARFIKKYLEQKDEVDFCFFLPSENVSKNTIHNNVVSQTTLLGAKNKSRAVIIADIPVNECGLYRYALENAIFEKSFTNVIDRIVLISQRLSVFILIKNGANKYVFSETDTNDYISSESTVFAPHLSLFHAIEWLKTHDSMLVWQYIVHNNKTESFFIDEEITWYKGNDETHLSGYLDFEKTLTDSFMKRMYRNALLRTLCLSKESKCEYLAEDPLMTGLVDYMNTLYFNKPHESDNTTIQLCSVYVSGSTQSGNGTYCINMYLHKNSTPYKASNSIMHLFAWPGKDLFPQKQRGHSRNYKRVGATYAIAPYGWRYFPVPRYKALDPEGKKIPANMMFFTREEAANVEFKSIYKCSPKDTYAYWQGKNGSFMGISHVEYESKHDIVFFNIPFIVKESFLLGGDLACFLLGEIATHLGLDVDRMAFHENEKFRDDVKKYVQDRFLHDEPRQCSLLVYPYHSNTEIVIDIIKEYLVGLPVLMVPLIPIIKERNGTSFQPSPLTSEFLGNEIKKLKKSSGGDVDVNVLFFDDSIVDGKTLEEVKHIMYGLGAKHVVSMFIIERRRIPSNTSDDTRTSAFWRLDIPRLGTKQNCPFCSVLGSISDFSSQLISENAKKRVDKWIEVWKARTESTLDRNQTINPRIINLEHPRKRFGIHIVEDECKQCGGEDQRIELFSSFGLTLYMGELLGITPRDDKMLQYCSDKYHLDEYTILEMLCTNLLLYGRTISKRVRERIVEFVFSKANSFCECNNHTAFAALVLMTQEKEVLSVMKDHYETMVRSNLRPNYDILILLSYLGMHYPNDFSDYDEPKKLRRTLMIHDDSYRLFHSEMYNGHGKTHDRPIGRLLVGNIDSLQELKRVVDALDCIIFALDHIVDRELSDWNDLLTPIYIGDIKELVSKKKKLFIDLEWDAFNDNKQHYMEEMRSLFTILSGLHERLFIPLNIINPRKSLSSEFVLYDRMKKWANNDKFDIGFVHFDRPEVVWENIFEQWVIWDRDIDDEIEYLIKNAHQYSNGEFAMDKDNSSNKIHKVWVSVEYDITNHKMSLLLFNKSVKKAEYVRAETAKKTRYGKIHLDEMGVVVKYNDKPEGIIETRIVFQLV